MMGPSHAVFAERVKAFCGQLGGDPWLVQGAGGNVSWKHDSVLWVKASGMRLGDALSREIFVPVNLPKLQQAIAQGDFSVVPEVVDASALKPSIETLLHALMPHRLVVHLHPVQVLSILVRRECGSALQSLIPSTLSWSLVDYHKPGLHLAEAVGRALQQDPRLRVLFLRNHGVVIGADSIAEAEETIAALGQLCECHRPLAEDPHNLRGVQPEEIEGYRSASNPFVQALALNPSVFAMLQACWALYPDHVVFLGAAPHTYASPREFNEKRAVEGGTPPDLIFVAGSGVYTMPSFTDSKAEQLQCYAEVLMRQPSLTDLNPLSKEQVDELLNWDAEKYRIQLSR